MKFLPIYRTRYEFHSFSFHFHRRTANLGDSMVNNFPHLERQSNPIYPNFSYFNLMFAISIA